MIDTVAKLFRDFAEQKAKRVVLLSKDKAGVFQPIKWGELYETARQLGAGLLSLQVKRNDHIGIISDNRKEWLMADMAMLAIGCADVPRGSDSMPNEIAYILKHANCAVSFVENETQYQKLLGIKPSLPSLETIVVMDEDFETLADRQQGVRVLTFQGLMELGRSYLEKNQTCFEEEIEKSTPEELATIIYTSGTTGEPKGVMLSHANYMHQIQAPHKPLDVSERDVFMSVLPVWHSFERAVEYFVLFAGCTMGYSQPISQVLREDFQKLRPTVLPSVPRIWERFKQTVYKTVNDEGGLKKALFNFFISIGSTHAKLLTRFRGLKPQFEKRSRFLDMLVAFFPLLLLTPLRLLGNLLVFKKLKARLGGRFRFGVSGGGALPPHVDDFFAAAGILLLEGYGLTESSPIVSVRDCRRPVPDTIGVPLSGVEVKVVDESGNVLAPGQKGVLHVKGLNIMQGYLKKPEETSAAVDVEGWLDTGDLAMLTHRGEIKILGRVKETIVLLGGENIEPAPIEDTLNESEFIEQAMVVGQDKKNLAALIVPNMEAVEEYAKTYGIVYEDTGDLLSHDEITNLIMGEIGSRVNPRRGFKLFERINRIRLLPEPFEVGTQITHTLKLKRNVIADMLAHEIEELFE